MIKLTRKSGGPIYINPDYLVDTATQNNAEQTTIITVSTSGDGYYTVLEYPEEVARKVLEYKLALTRYNAAQIWSVKHHGDPPYLSSIDETNLLQLAGLEESE